MVEMMPRFFGGGGGARARTAGAGAGAGAGADPARRKGSLLLDKTDAYAPPSPPPRSVLLMQIGPVRDALLLPLWVVYPLSHSGAPPPPFCQVNEGAEGDATKANVDALLGAAAASGEYTYASYLPPRPSRWSCPPATSL